MNDVRSVVQAPDQKLTLPIANITRLMRHKLPENVKISREAKEVVQQCLYEFIGFLTSIMSETLIEDQRKTITGEDLIQTTAANGYDDFIPQLRVFLNSYRHSKNCQSHRGLKRARREVALNEASL